MFKKFYNALSRRKTHHLGEEDTEMKRSLNLLDLTALGIGSTLGLGVYVLAGEVAYDIAGPAVILSFLIAGTASIFAAICYAEFSTRIARTGSAYVYSYVGVGEFVAYSIGWDLMLEYIIGTASLARGLSGYLDNMLDNNISKALTEVMPIRVPHLATYPDFLSFTVILLLTAMLAYGMRESSYFNLFCTILNLSTILTVIVAGSFHANIKNWQIPEDEVPDGFGSGGFIPFGIAGMFAGAAKCFFGFVGFDGIATVTEEALNPKRDIALSILLSILISLLAYLGISTVLTLMLPYFEQHPTAPFPTAFAAVHWYTIRWIVSIGGMFALTAGLLGSMFPTPRILYAMALDGLVFKILSNVNSSTRTPIMATLVAGLFSAIMALVFDLSHLVDMMSIGTLMAYTIVALCVLILRYQDDDMEFPENVSILRQLFNLNDFKNPNLLTSRVVKVSIVIFSLICIFWCITSKIFDFISISGIISTIICFVLAVSTLIIIALQPVSKSDLIFRTPLVPFLPAISILSNFYLMFQLNIPTWIRYIVWMSIGYIIYYSYGIIHSRQRELDKQKLKE